MNRLILGALVACVSGLVYLTTSSAPLEKLGYTAETPPVAIPVSSNLAAQMSVVSASQSRRSSIQEVPDPLAEFDRVPAVVRLRAAEHLESLGWTRTNVVGRIHVGGRPGLLNQLGLVQVQDGSVGDGQGEMVVWDWDDGNPNTMEGEVYWYDYASGEEMLLYMQYGVEDEYDPVPISAGALWTNNDDFVGAGSVWATSKSRPLPGLTRDTRVVRVANVEGRTSEYCCLSAWTLNNMQLQCFTYNTGQVPLCQ